MAGLGVHRFIFSDESSALAAAAKVLRRIKTKRAHVADHADRSALVAGTDRLRAILDYVEPVLPRDGDNLGHARGLTEKVDNNNALRARGNRSLKFRGIEIERAFLDVGEDGRRADVVYAPSGRDESERRGDDFVARAEAGDHAGDVERRGAAIHRERARVAERGCEGLLKILNVLAEAKARGVVGGGQRGERRLAEGLVLEVEVEERDFHFESCLIRASTRLSRLGVLAMKSTGIPTVFIVSLVWGPMLPASGRTAFLSSLSAAA